MEFPKGTKFFDVEKAAVAQLPDGTCVLLDRSGPKSYENRAKVYMTGLRISKTEFHALATRQ